MKRSLFVALCALLICTPFVPAQSSAPPPTTDDALTLLVRVQSRHIDYFEACVPVHVNEPFRIVWGGETVKDVVTGTIGNPVGDDYPTTLTISEGNGQCRTETAPKLKLDEPLQWSNVASVLFKHIDTYRFVLSKKPCDVETAPNKSLDRSGGSVFRIKLGAAKVA